MAADASPPRPDDSTPALRFEDGLGPRLAAQDAFGEPIEHLRLCPDLAALEPALRERIGRLINFRHARYVRLRGSERLPGPDKHIVIAYDAVQGVRLAQVLELAAHGALTLDIDTALLIVRELLPAIAVLHDSRSVTHGAIGPERLVLTTPGRLLIVDHGLGLALGKLAYSRRKFWQQLRVAVPPGTAKVVFDARTDVVQIGLVALALVLGRPIGRDEYPQDLAKLIDGAREQPAKGAARPLSPELRGWLERALPTSHKAPFLTVREAQQAFETLFTRTRPAAGAAALKTLSNACEAALNGTIPASAELSDSLLDPNNSASTTARPATPSSSVSTMGSASRPSLASPPSAVPTVGTAAGDAAGDAAAGTSRVGSPRSASSSPSASMLTPVPSRPRRVPLVTPIADEEMPRVKSARGEPRSGEAAEGTARSRERGGASPASGVSPLDGAPAEKTPVEKAPIEKAPVEQAESAMAQADTEQVRKDGAASVPAAIAQEETVQAAPSAPASSALASDASARPASAAFGLDAMAALRALEAELSASEIDERESGCGTARELISPSHSELAGLSNVPRLSNAPNTPNAGSFQHTLNTPDTPNLLNLSGSGVGAASVGGISPTPLETSDAASDSSASEAPGVSVEPAAPVAPVAPGARDDAGGAAATGAFGPFVATVGARPSSSSPSPDSVPSSEAPSSAVVQPTSAPMMEPTAQELSAFEQAASDTYQDAASSLRARTQTEAPANAHTAAPPPASVAKSRALDAQAILMLTSVDDETSLDLAFAPPDAGAPGVVDAPVDVARLPASTGSTAAGSSRNRAPASVDAHAVSGGRRVDEPATRHDGEDARPTQSPHTRDAASASASPSPSVAAPVVPAAAAPFSSSFSFASADGEAERGVDPLRSVAPEDAVPKGATSSGAPARVPAVKGVAPEDARSELAGPSGADTNAASAPGGNAYRVGTGSDADAALSDDRVDASSASSASSRPPAPVATRSRWLRFRRAAPVVDDVGRGDTGEAERVGETGAEMPASESAAVSAAAAGLASAPTSASASQSESGLAFDSVSARVIGESSPSPVGGDDVHLAGADGAARDAVSSAADVVASASETATSDDEKATPARGGWFRLRKPARAAKGERSRKEPEASISEPSSVTAAASVDAGRRTPLDEAMAQATANTLAESSTAAMTTEQLGSASEAASTSTPTASTSAAPSRPASSSIDAPGAVVRDSAPAVSTPNVESREAPRVHFRVESVVEPQGVKNVASDAHDAALLASHSSQRDAEIEPPAPPPAAAPARSRWRLFRKTAPDVSETPASSTAFVFDPSATASAQAVSEASSEQASRDSESTARASFETAVPRIEPIARLDPSERVESSELPERIELVDRIEQAERTDRSEPLDRIERPEPAVERGEGTEQVEPLAQVEQGASVEPPESTPALHASEAVEPPVARSRWRPFRRAVRPVAEPPPAAAASTVVEAPVLEEPVAVAVAAVAAANADAAITDASSVVAASAVTPSFDASAPALVAPLAASPEPDRASRVPGPQLSSASDPVSASPEVYAADAAGEAAAELPATWRRGDRQAPSASPEIGERSNAASAADLRAGLLIDAAPALISSAPSLARATRPPRARLHINWKRTLAASLVVSLLEGVAFATAWWFAVPTEPGSLLVETSPPGVEVLVDGRVSGKTPYSASMPPGRHTIELRRGATSRVIPVEISAGVQTSQRVMWSKGLRTGQARITSVPDGARVMIDGQAHGITPLTVSTLAAGRHTVVITSDSGTVSAPLSISPGETTEMDVPVFPGWVSVLAPVELSIHEGERLLGTTEGEKLMLAPGRHVLLFTSEPLGYKTTQTVLVTPGATVAVSLVLPKVPVAVQGPAGAQLFIDGEPAGTLPIDSVRAALGTRDFTIRHPQLGERRQAITVTQHAPARIVFD